MGGGTDGQLDTAETQPCPRMYVPSRIALVSAYQVHASHKVGRRQLDARARTVAGPARRAPTDLVSSPGGRCLRQASSCLGSPGSLAWQN